MIRSFLSVVITFCLFSCNREPQQLLIGDWEQIDLMREFPDPPHGERRSKFYTFLNDSLVDTKRSYYKKVTNRDVHYEPKFIGRVTKYKIENDKLSFYDLEDSVWGAGRSYRLSNDTLFLFGKNGTKEAFKKYVYNLDKEPHFDQIILSTSGCFGSCPIMNILIEQNGEVEFYGEHYVDKLGFFTGHISKETFLNIENEFRKAKVADLKRNYSASWTDDEQITTTFCNDGEIINSVRDYARSGPDELVWAYPLLRYLFQDVAMNKLDASALPFYGVIRYSQFQRGNEFCFLSKSEAFLLQNYLRRGTLVEKKIDSGFNLNYRKNILYVEPSKLPKEDEIEKVKSIITDGRYYTFNVLDQKSITIDIGFNFLEVNKSFLVFEKIE